MNSICKSICHFEFASFDNLALTAWYLGGSVYVLENPIFSTSYKSRQHALTGFFFA